MHSVHVSALPSPALDIALLTDSLGRAWGVSSAESLPQYLAWCDAAGVFEVLAREGSVSAVDLAAHTDLTAQGVDALIPILASIGVVRRDGDRWMLSPLGAEYLVRGRTFYVGAGLYWDCRKPCPAPYVKGGATTAAPAGSAPLWDPALRLQVPHSRNFSPSVVAARCGEFEHLVHLVDVGGGSGVFAIPLALDQPATRITLVDMPDLVRSIEDIVASFGVSDRIEVIGMDMFRDEWRFGDCDGVFFGNVLHGTDDVGCELLARKAFAALTNGGRIWIHEVLFKEDRTGPLVAALWNANMIARRPGARQRTGAELSSILRCAGFESCHMVPTAGHFSLVAATKP